VKNDHANSNVQKFSILTMILMMMAIQSGVAQQDQNFAMIGTSYSLPKNLPGKISLKYPN
jgi:hypothetical protein